MGSSNRSLATALAAALALALAAALWVAAGREGAAAEGDRRLAVPLSLGELARDGAEHAGQTVVLASVVEDVLGPDRTIDVRDRGRSAFTFGAAGEVILVGRGVPRLAALAAGQAIEPGDVVQVTGEVRLWSRRRIEAAIGQPLAQQFAGDFPRVVILLRDVTTVRVPVERS